VSDDFEIPAYVPQAEGDEVLLAYLAHLHRSNADGSFDQRDADLFLERAITVGGQAVIDRILRLLNQHPLVEDAWQRNNPAFHSRSREYGTASDLRTRIAAILTLNACLLRHRRAEILFALYRIAKFFRNCSRGNIDSQQERLEQEWRGFVGLWNIEIDDRKIGLAAAAGALNTVSTWGHLAEAATDAARRGAMRRSAGWIRFLPIYAASPTSASATIPR
jgi:hypothetical protein